MADPTSTPTAHGPRRYRKRPVEVEAYGPLTRDNLHAVATWCHGKARLAKLAGPGRGMHTGVRIETLEGVMTADLGDYVIRGVQGELYPRKPDIFAATYEPVAESDRG